MIRNIRDFINTVDTPTLTVLIAVSLLLIAAAIMIPQLVFTWIIAVATLGLIYGLARMLKWWAR